MFDENDLFMLVFSKYFKGEAHDLKPVHASGAWGTQNPRFLNTFEKPHQIIHGEWSTLQLSMGAGIVSNVQHFLGLGVDLLQQLTKKVNYLPSNKALKSLLKEVVFQSKGALY